MSAPPAEHPVSLSTSGYHDGLGLRTLIFDREHGVMLERLILRPELGAFEQALGTRAARIAALDDERFARVRAVQRDPDTGWLTVLSEFIAGNRLCDLIEAAATAVREEMAAPSVDVALGYLTAVLPALESLHASAGMTHGAVGPGRVLLTPKGEIVMLDAIYAEALERLQFTRSRLWTEFGLGMSPAPGAARFDIAADLAQASLAAVALVLGRPLGPHEYPEGIAALLVEVVEIAQIRCSASFATALQHFLQRTLPLPGQRPYASAHEAQTDLQRLVHAEMGAESCRTALVSFVQEISAAADPVPVPAPATAKTVERPAAAAPAPTPTPSRPIEERTPAAAPAAAATPKPPQSAAPPAPPVRPPAPVKTFPAATAAAAPAPAAPAPKPAPAPTPAPAAFEPPAVVKPAPTAAPEWPQAAAPPAPPRRIWPPAISIAPPPVIAAATDAPSPGVASGAPPAPAWEPSAPPVVAAPATDASNPPAPPSAAPVDAKVSPKAKGTKKRHRGPRLRDKLRSIAVKPPAPAPVEPPAPPAPPPPPPRPPLVAAPPVQFTPAPEPAWRPAASLAPPATMAPAPPFAVAPGAPPQFTPMAAPAPAPISLAPAAAPISLAPPFAPPPAPAPIRLKSEPSAPVRIKTDAPIGFAPPKRASRPEPSIYEPALAPRADRDGQAGHSSFPWKLAAAVIIVMAIGVTAGRAYLPSGRTTAADSPPPAKIPAVPAPPAPLAGKGSIVVETQPAGAHILLDGKPAGDTPLRLDDVSPGRHVVMVSTASASVKKVVKVEAGKTVSIDLAVYSGWVAIYSPIVLDVSEGGQALGNTEQSRLMLPPGHHTLTLTNRELGYSSEHAVDIEPGEERTLNVQPQGGLSINAQPWAEIFIDGKRAGETPLANLKVALGTREVVFKHPQYGERRMTITVRASAPSALSVDMSKPPDR